MLNEIYQALDPIAFWIGPFAIRWYGLGYILGILLGGFALLQICKRWKIRFSVDALLTLFIAAVLGIVIGARLGYVFFYGEGYYFQNPAEIFAFSNGGMSFHGGVIGMAIAAYIASRLIKMPFASLGDLIVIVAPIGIFLVRITNFINGELWGAPTDLPWGVEFESGGGIARHPSQLYEAFLEGLVLFVVMMILSRRKPPLPRGSYMGVFFILYGVFRIAIEFVREPDAHIGYLAGDWLTMGMVLCLPMLVIGAALLVYAAKTKHPQVGLPDTDESVKESDNKDDDASDEEPADNTDGKKDDTSDDESAVSPDDKDDEEPADNTDDKEDDTSDDESAVSPDDKDDDTSDDELADESDSNPSK